MKPFPVGGPREPVFSFLQQRGFLMSRNTDKWWLRADGVEVHIYGAGSQARVYNKEGKLLADGPIAETVLGLTGSK